MEKNHDELSFRISSGLKNLIGRDLISDRYIAVFELVKNSYDAGASKVKISFLTSSSALEEIIISDNGCGMSYEDIIQKWLFVAYSEKKPQHRDQYNFRNKIKREVAGAKGVGRFSCDRLGESLRLITKTKNERFAHVVDVDWNRFELDDTKEFMDIPVDYSRESELPDDFPYGTTLVVQKLREPWNRDELLKLKRSLMKLISPDANNGAIPFTIEIFAPKEKENDEKISRKNNVNLDRDIVNGMVHNDIFEKLHLKTTSIEVNVSEDGKSIKSKLSDRGEYIFTVVEKNRNYSLLKNIHIVIFYLNRSAKYNFTAQMGGVHPKDYGSVFIYKSGFRINPYGESGQDFFGIDQRKAQGYNRFLGTREIMGRISIQGDNDEFIETTSRAHGFIRNESVDMLVKLFLEKVLRVLEKYVVHLINWGEPLIKTDPSTAIYPDVIGDQILSQFILNVDSNDVLDVDYNKQIIQNYKQINQTDNISSSLNKLEVVAKDTNNTNLIELARTVRQRTESILSHNAELEKENTEKSKDLVQAQQANQAREKQVYFLQGVTNQNVTNLINGFHSVYTLTDALKGNIAYLREILSGDIVDKKDLILSIVSEIFQSNEKAHKLADLAIHGNQSLKQSGDNSIYDFIHQYIDAGFTIKGLKYIFPPDSKPYNCKFDAASIGIILDNIASNSIKARATYLKIIMSETARYVTIAFADDGIGLSNDIDPKMLFELGISSNISHRGFGIGLYHIKQLVDEMDGNVYIDEKYKNGFKLVVNLKK